jgi:hypothetical protein
MRTSAGSELQIKEPKDKTSKKEATNMERKGRGSSGSGQTRLYQSNHSKSTRNKG